jgi:osmotically-inducible protein OsmY
MLKFIHEHSRHSSVDAGEAGGAADLRVKVANALHWNFAIPPHRVTAEVDHGLVTLKGVVERGYQKSFAEATVRQVSGVVGVRNEIAVRDARETETMTLSAQS